MHQRHDVITCSPKSKRKQHRNGQKSREDEKSNRGEKNRNSKKSRESH